MGSQPAESGKRGMGDIFKRKRDGIQTPILVILDMNGVLLFRNTSNKASGEMRPHLQHLLTTLFVKLAGRVVVAVWSSMMKHNLHALIEMAFGQFANRLAFAWDQSCCTQCHVPGMRKPLFRKDLGWLRRSPMSQYVPGRVLLIDDDPIKCTENPKGTAVHPSSWCGSKADPALQDTELLRLAGYIKAILDSNCGTVPEFVMSRPFENFELAGAEIATTELVVPAKRLRTDTSSKGELACLTCGSTVVAFRPDEDVWLSAVVKSVQKDAQVCVVWDQDGTESILPPDHVRRPASDQEQQAKKSSPNPWRRMASRSTAGVFYYYNTKTGISNAEPPPPWQKRSVAGKPGKIQYYNQKTAKVSYEKPELAAFM